MRQECRIYGARFGQPVVSENSITGEHTQRQQVESAPGTDFEVRVKPPQSSWVL